MLTKRKMGKGKVRVTFSMPPLEGVKMLNLVGDFNNWSITENPMRPEPGGGWSTAVTLESGREYAFRYLADGEQWHNDWAADRYLPNEHGSDNSVVSLREDALLQPAPRRAASKKKV